jgi:GH25 family lysozyme M1 (1,4-beta-N-acetylmuramidase)
VKREDFRQPDVWPHFKKTLRRYVADAVQRVKRVDVQALAATWEVNGVDISYWNGDVDFDKLATMVQFVYIRAGYGNDYVDPRCDEYRLGCERVGLPFGLYWYVVPDKDHIKHATSFHTKRKGKPGKLYPVFDLEESRGLSKSVLGNWYEKLYKVFNALTGNAYEDDATYTSAGFLNTAIALTNYLKRTWLWVANWTLALFPLSPNEWLNPGKIWKFWQWLATGKGSDYGVSSRYVDLNRYNGTRAQFEAEFGVALPPPPPPPDQEENVMQWYVRSDATPHLNVRSSPAGTDVGDLLPGATFAVKNVVYAYSGVWAQISGGQFDGMWVCLHNSGGRYCEPVGTPE